MLIRELAIYSYLFLQNEYILVEFLVLSFKYLKYNLSWSRAQ